MELQIVLLPPDYPGADQLFARPLLPSHPADGPLVALRQLPPGNPNPLRRDALPADQWPARLTDAVRRILQYRDRLPKPTPLSAPTGPEGGIWALQGDQHTADAVLDQDFLRLLQERLGLEEAFLAIPCTNLLLIADRQPVIAQQALEAYLAASPPDALGLSPSVFALRDGRVVGMACSQVAAAQAALAESAADDPVDTLPSDDDGADEEWLDSDEDMETPPAIISMVRGHQTVLLVPITPTDTEDLLYLAELALDAIADQPEDYPFDGEIHFAVADDYLDDEEDLPALLQSLSEDFTSSAGESGMQTLNGVPWRIVFTLAEG